MKNTKKSRKKIILAFLLTTLTVIEATPIAKAEECNKNNKLFVNGNAATSSGVLELDYNSLNKLSSNSSATIITSAEEAITSNFNNKFMIDDSIINYDKLLGAPSPHDINTYNKYSNGSSPIKAVNTSAGYISIVPWNYVGNGYDFACNGKYGNVITDRNKYKISNANDDEVVTTADSWINFIEQGAFNYVANVVDVNKYFSAFEGASLSSITDVNSVIIADGGKSVKNLNMNLVKPLSGHTSTGVFTFGVLNANDSRVPVYVNDGISQDEYKRTNYDSSKIGEQKDKSFIEVTVKEGSCPVHVMSRYDSNYFIEEVNTNEKNVIRKETKARDGLVYTGISITVRLHDLYPTTKEEVTYKIYWDKNSKDPENMFYTYSSREENTSERNPFGVLEANSVHKIDISFSVNGLGYGNYINIVNKILSQADTETARKESIGTPDLMKISAAGDSAATNSNESSVITGVSLNSFDLIPCTSDVIKSNTQN